MADSSATANSRRFRNENVKNKNEISRNEIQSAIDKSVELRALHAALMQEKTPVFRFSARNYPVFTPSYEDESLCSNNWDCYEPQDEKDEKSHHKKENSSSNKGSRCGLANSDSHICPADDQISVNGSFTNQVTVPETSPKTDFSKSSRRTSLAHLRSESTSCNKCKPAIIIKERGVPSIDSDSSLLRNRGKNLSRLFTQFNKKNKNENDSSSRLESEKQTQTFNDISKTSIDTLQKELMEANAIRDKALIQVLEMRSSLGELKQKLEFLETYCEDLKKALQKAAMEKDSETNQKHLMPVTEEVMVEGFLQIVSEARSSARQFCKLLIGQVEEDDTALKMLLQPHKLSVNSKYSRNALYHLEGIINQQLYQNFENCVFKKNGSQKNLNPRQDREKQFSSYVGLRNLSWNEVLRKGAKCYSEEFSKFCDEKMSCVITALKWTRTWPERLLQAFFVSAKCVWLLHSLAFSFDPPIGILRVDEDRGFDSVYMEDLLMDKQRSQGSSRVKVMVMPGFYVQDKVLRCKVLCKYKSVIN